MGHLRSYIVKGEFMKLYAVTYEQDVKPWITPGKKYEVIDIVATTRRYGRGFETISDSGNLDWCLERGCSHLNEGDWTLVEEEDLS